MTAINYAGAAGAAALVGLLYCLGQVVYNLFFHPLARFPGPILFRASRIPYLYHAARGDMTFRLLPFHERYGAVVRVAPDELSFVHPDAWKDIYGHRVGSNQGVAELTKAARFYRTQGTKPNIISEGDRKNHGMVRRLLSHGFSERRLREQEPVIVHYADKLIQQLRAHCQRADAGGEGGGGDTRVPLDMTAWYNWVTVDIISDLTFGEPSYCLDKCEHDPWITAMNHTVNDFVKNQAVRYLGLEGLLGGFVRLFLNKKRKHHLRVTVEKIQRRLELDPEKPDLVDSILAKKDEWNIPFDAILGNSAALLIAGSETTATLLAGLTFILCSYPEHLEKVKQEVRSSFKSDKQINLHSVLGLTYMLVCLDEAMRYYPPVPIGPLRTVPAGGVRIAGEYVPEGTDVAVWHYPMFHYSKHWTKPFEYHPERWLRGGQAGQRVVKDWESYTPMAERNTAPVGEGEFAGDRLGMLEPFNVGPRNCLGRNLANAELRLIFARMIFNFDMELVDKGDHGWIERQKAGFLWLKGPLQVYLTPVNREV